MKKYHSFICEKFTNGELYCDYDLLKRELENGLDPNSTDNNNIDSPLIIWMSFNSYDDNFLESIKLLIYYGADINLKNSNQDTALSILSNSSHGKSKKLSTKG